MSQESKQKHEDLSNPQSIGEYLRLFFTGFAMGASDIIPGVSGGTIAFILGIYETLINAIKAFDITAIRLALSFKIKEVLDHVSFRFLLALGLGILTAILTLSGLLSRTMDDPVGRIFLFAFFFGLVLASILTVGVKVNWNAISIILLVIGAVVAFLIVTLAPVQGSHDPLKLFVSGMIAITAMILPGISGSFMLLIMGEYDYILTAVTDRNFGPIIFLGLGCVVGIIAFSRVLSFLLSRYYDATVAALVGFLVGSLWKIYPWKQCLEEVIDPRHPDELRCLAEQNIVPTDGGQVVIAILLALAGFILVNFLDHLQSKQNPVFRRIWKRV